ncbi:MAG: aromatic-ring-hydroxylating dioxygenase subunit beta [Aquisalimonadaceae bacterium]
MRQLTRQEAEEFLHREAALLDEGKFEDWLELFAEDARYWMPTAMDDDAGVGTPLVYDDRSSLEDRVSRLRNRNFHAQVPRSRTLHFTSNVFVEDAEEGARVLSNFILYEFRLSEQRTFAGRCEHTLRHEVGAWKIARKKIWLLNRDQPLRNLTFLI